MNVKWYTFALKSWYTFGLKKTGKDLYKSKNRYIFVRNIFSNHLIRMQLKSYIRF